MLNISEHFKIVALLIFFLISMLLDFLPFAHAEEGNVYVIHVSSFKNRNKAEREISNLNKLNLNTFYKYEVVEGKGAWFRVYIGTFNDKKEAQARGSELIDKGIISYFKSIQVQQSFTTVKESVQSKKMTEQYFEEPEELKRLPVIKLQSDVDKKKKSKLVPEPKAMKMTERAVSLVEKKEMKRRNKKGILHSKSPFSLSLNAGGFRSGSASDFVITEVSGAVTNIYALKTMASQVAFASSFRLYGEYDLYGSITYLFGNRINSIFLSFGPKKTFDISDWASIYLKGGVVYGNFNWNGPPGDFEGDYGLEAGFGTNLLRTRIKVGLDFLYRNIEFDYNGQGMSGVSANSSSIDFSGFSISGSIKYFF